MGNCRSDRTYVPYIYVRRGKYEGLKEEEEEEEKEEEEEEEEEEEVGQVPLFSGRSWREHHDMDCNMQIFRQPIKTGMLSVLDMGWQDGGMEGTWGWAMVTG
ncbi:hypothetical protein VM1G_11999 [Cytospora mali]|uniref:Uncharacterized protein n=1 Tax=Cytospora mali TaxID=578113 RepID=A0A194VI48_CYTMA|nr:hypothetical protein VM1G_11999 [Valsa mali]